MQGTRLLILRIASGLHFLLSLLVPREYRARWREEWRAELWSALADPDSENRASPFGVLLRALGAVRDAFHLRAADAREIYGGAKANALDLRHAARLLRRKPTASAAVVITMGVALGATTAVFAVVDRVLLRPLPYEDAGELAMIFRTVPQFGFERSSASFPDFSDWAAQTRSFASLASYGYLTQIESRADGARQWVGYRVTSNLFSTLGVGPSVGRGFLPSDDEVGAPPVAILSYGTFESRFGGDVGVLGLPMTLDDEGVTIVGVMPEGFQFPGSEAEYWRPLRGDLARMERDSNFLSVIGRLAPGTTVEAAQREMTELAGRIDESAPDANEGLGVFVESRHTFEVRNSRTALLVFSGAVLLVLLVACANVANLQLAQVVARRRELGLRSALGARGGRLATQLLLENLLLATAAGAMGVVVSRGILAALRFLGPAGLPRLDEVRMDLWVYAVSALIVLGAGLLFGVVPALWGARQDAGPLVREGGAGGGNRRWAVTAQRGFASGQIAMAIGLLIGAGLLTSSFARLTAIAPGFDPEGLIVARVPMPPTEEPEMPPGADGMSREELVAALQPQLALLNAARHSFFDRLEERVAGLPGVQRVALSYGFPFADHRASTYATSQESPTPLEERPSILNEVVGPSYFQTMGIPLRAGRGFEAADDDRVPPVAVINEALAELFWPAADPVGRRILIGNGGREATVIGVVSDVRQRSLGEERTPLFYTSLRQEQWPDAVFLVVRAPQAGADLIPLVRGAVAEIDPRLPVTEIAVAEQLLAGTVSGPLFRTMVLSVFGFLALLVAAVGTYGVIAFQVGERQREFGIRMALGARRGRILRQVLGSGLKLTAIGAVAGVSLALLLARFLESMLFGIGAWDVTSFTTAVTIAFLATIVACYLPAHRATRIPPLESLRQE